MKTIASLRVCLLSVLCLLAAPPARAISPDLSSWQRCLSSGEATNAVQSEFNQEVVVVGDIVHMIWTATLMSDYWHTSNTNRLYYRRSLDGGRSWESAILLEESDTLISREGGPQRWLAVDGDSVHVAAVRNNGAGGDWYYMLDYFRSTDNGASFSPRQTFRAPENVWVISQVFVTVGAGQVNIFYQYSPNWYNRGIIACRTSTDGGSTFSGSVVTDVAESMNVYDVRQQGSDLLLIWETGLEMPGSYAWYSDVNVAVSVNGGSAYSISTKLNGKGIDGYGHAQSMCDYHSKSDIAKAGANVYAVWTGAYTNDAACVFVSRSTDNGVTFAPQVNLSLLLPAGAPAPQFGHAAVAAKGNCVYVVCTLVNSQVFYWASTDGGATFTAAELTSATTQSMPGGWWPLVMVDPQSADGRKVHFYCIPDLHWVSLDAGATVQDGMHYSTYYTWPSNNPSNPQWAIGADGALHLTYVGAYSQRSDSWLYTDREIWYRRVEPQSAPPTARNAALTLWADRDQVRYDSMQIPYAADLAFSNSFTLEAWVRFTTGSANNTDILFQENSAHYMGGIVLGSYEWSGTRHPMAKVYTPAGMCQVWGGETLIDGAWNHLAFTYDAGNPTNNARLYVNGILSATATTAGLVPPNRGEFWVGKSRSTYETFIGQVDDIRLWNRALSDVEVHDNLGSPRLGTEAGLVAYFPLDDSTRDVTGRGHDGVLMYRESFDTGFRAVPVFTSPALTAGVIGHPFLWKVVADYATGLEVRGLPAGLALDGKTGFITGTPSVSGVFDAQVTATNFQDSARQTLRIVVSDGRDVLFREDFNGPLSGWDALSVDTNYYSFEPGMLAIRANNGETYTSYNRPLNLFAISNRFGGDFMITVGVARYTPSADNYNRLCLAAYDDMDNALRFAYGYGNGRQFELLSEQLQVPVGVGVPFDLGDQPFLLRLVKRGGGAGDLYTALYSVNGVDFLGFTNNTLAHGDGVPALLGFWMGIDSTEKNRALIDYFEVAALPSATVDTLADDFRPGNGAPSWHGPDLASAFGVSRAGDALTVSKPVGGTGDPTDWATFQSAGMAVGDFDVRFDYRDALLATTSGGWGNQIQLNCTIGDFIFFVVRGNEPSYGGPNVHVWTGRSMGIVPVTGDAGTLRIVRTGAVIKAFHNDQFIYQCDCPLTPATFSLSLQNNGTSDAVSATFDNFVLSAQQVLFAAPVFTTARLSGGMVGAPFVFQVTADYASTLQAVNLPRGLALGPTGLITGTPTVSGVFDVRVTAANMQGSTAQNLRLVLRAPSGVVFREDFSGALASGWTQVPSDTSFYSLQPGLLRLRANYGDTWTSYNRPLNLFSVANPLSGNFVVQLGVSRFVPSLRDSPGIFVVGWDDTDNNVRYSYAGGAGGPGLSMATEVQQSMVAKGGPFNLGTEPFVMRLSKEGTVYTASWSTNGVDFVPVPECSLPYGDGTPAQLGFWMGLDPQLKDLMLIDYFELLSLPATGTFDRWAFDHNLGGPEGSLSGNPTGDGVLNVFKYAFGVEPPASAQGKLPTYASDSTHLVLTFRQLLGGTGVVGVDYTAGGIVYTVEATDSLGKPWSSGPLVAELVPGSRVPNGDGTETVSVRVSRPAGSASKFVRLALRRAGY